MRIRLIDIDSKIPNLALMKLSAHHKARGDSVSFDEPDPDRIYASVVFKQNAWKARGLRFMFPHASFEIGGTGIDLAKRLPDEIEFCKPDYDLYPSTYSLGFTTRGCIRKCPFCIVPMKEGRFRRAQHIREWHDDRFDSVICLDNNVYADKTWFFENTEFVLEQGLRYNAIQGMDIRILDEEIAGRLADLKWSGRLHFAFDRLSDEPAVRQGIQTLQGAGINTRHDVTFYVLVGFDSSPEEDYRRCEILREIGAGAFIMQYQRTPWTRSLARLNRPQIYWSCDLSDFAPKRQAVRQ
ncbi:MAG: hypothetical protein PHD17_12645 [Methanothrix soehngenii]|nr:hypothetical protein [Methanothrix soehngenii]